MIERPTFDEAGARVARCMDCGMVWIEHRESIELVPGGGSAWTTIAGEREHTCPEPMPYEQARAMADHAKAVGGIVVSQRVRAAIRLGLERGRRSA